MEQDGEAPGVAKGDEVGLAGVVVEVHDLEHAYLLLGHLRTIQALCQRGMRHCQRSVTSGVAGQEARTAGPQQEDAPVFPPLKVGHYAVDDVRFRGEEVDGIRVFLVRPAVLDVLNV